MFPPSIYHIEFFTPHASTFGMVPACCPRHALATARDLMQVEGIKIKVVENLELIIATATHAGFDFILPDYETANAQDVN